jgi:predicted nucleotidyltransferase
MRLDLRDINIIKQSALKYFGNDVSVYLFGSRVNDNLKGGDIDLLINTNIEKMTFRNKVVFLAELKKNLGDQKIDLVFDKETKDNQFFLNSIKKQCSRIC